MTCRAPIPFMALAEYWFGDLEPRREAEVEEQMFACGHCSARLAELVALGKGVRGAFRRGALRVVITPAMLEKMRSEGLRLREYPVPSGGRVQCTIAADDDFVVSRLAAPLAGIERLDLVQSEGGAELRFDDVPFDPAAGEVLFLPPAAVLKRAPAHVLRLRLVAHQEGRERVLGEYTFDHKPG